MRWKGFITLTVLILLTVVFCWKFADKFVKKTIEFGGTKMWGAKVELNDVKISWSPLAIKLKGLAVASKEEELKNLLEITELSLGLDTPYLLRKKVIVNEMVGEGLVFQTERKSSGFLDKEELEKREQAEKKWKSDMSSWVSDIKKRSGVNIDVKSQFDPEMLLSMDKVKELEETSKALKMSYEKYPEIDADSAVSNAQDALNSIKNIKVSSVKDAEAARSRLESAGDSVSELDKTKKEIELSISKLKSDFSKASGSIKDLEKARNEDLKELLKKLKLPSIEKGDIAETVFGPVVTNKVNQLTGTFKKIRKYFPPKKKKGKPIKRPRSRGEDIIFSAEGAKPQLWIQKTGISGPGASIEITDIASEPWLTGKPIELKVKYNNIDLTAQIDRSEDIATDRILVKTPSFEIAGAMGALTADTLLSGEEINSQLKWKGKGLLPESMYRYLSIGDRSVSVTVAVKGDLENPSISISSDLDNIISEKLKKELDKKIQDARQQAKALIDNEVIARKDKALKDINGLRDEKLAEIYSYKAKVEGKKKEIENEIELKKKEIDMLVQQKTKEAQQKADQMKREAQKRAEAEKKEAEKKAKQEQKKLEKDAEKKIKNLFR